MNMKCPNCGHIFEPDEDEDKLFNDRLLGWKLREYPVDLDKK